jgi:ribosomal protein S18 acetylase RimI-like enzyme
MTKVIIRTAEPHDIISVSKMTKLANKEFDWYYASSTGYLRKVLAKSKHNIMVAEIGGNIVGHIKGQMHGSECCIDGIYVLKKYRNMKIGKQLMEEFVGYWKKHSEKISLFTKDWNVEIMRKMGFIKEMNYMIYRRSRHK